MLRFVAYAAAHSAALLTVPRAPLIVCHFPSFAFLSLEDRRKAGAYVFKLSGLLGKPEPPAFPDPGTPPSTTTAGLERGKALYSSQGCVACHGETGRGDGMSAATLKDNAGQPVRPRDFTTGIFRGGAESRDVYYRIFAGIDGTPMPSFAESVTEEIEREHSTPDGETWGERSPRCTPQLRQVPCIGDHPTPTRRRWLHTKAEEAEG